MTAPRRPSPRRARAALLCFAATTLVPACARASLREAAEAPAPAKPDPSAADAPRRAPAPLPPRVPPSPVVPRALVPHAPPRVSGPDGVLLRTDRERVTTADLGEFVLRWHPGVAASALRRLARETVVEAEAARERVEPPASAVAAAADRALADRLRALRLEHGGGGDPADLLRRETGRSPDELREDLRRAVRVDLLRERLARLDARRRDGIDLRVVVLPDERVARVLASQWREGADGGALARRLGADPPLAPPPVAPEDVPDAALRARLAAAAPGEVLDPVAFEADDPSRLGTVRTWWQVFRVVRSWKGTAAPWSELADEVERSLRDAPPSEDELDAWEARAARRLGLLRWDGAKGFAPSAPGE